MIKIILGIGIAVTIIASLIKSDTLATRIRKVHHGGASLGCDIVPAFGTHLVVRQRGLVCPWDDTVSIRRAIMCMYDADSIVMRNIEVNEDSTLSADIYINGKIPFDFVMRQDLRCGDID